jgi:hypothetical protein
MDFSNLFWSLGILLVVAVVFAYGLGAFEGRPSEWKDGEDTDSSSC